MIEVAEMKHGSEKMQDKLTMSLTLNEVTAKIDADAVFAAQQKERAETEKALNDLHNLRVGAHAELAKLKTQRQAIKERRDALKMMVDAINSVGDEESTAAEVNALLMHCRAIVNPQCVCVGGLMADQLFSGVVGGTIVISDLPQFHTGGVVRESCNEQSQRYRGQGNPGDRRGL